MGDYTTGEVAAASEPRDAWWTVLVVDPVAVRLTRAIVNNTPVTPAQLTVVGAVLAVAATGSFLQAGLGWRVAGALLFLAAFLLDCMGAKLARLTGTTSVFGSWLGAISGRLVGAACAVAVLAGQHVSTDAPAFPLLAVLVLGCHLICQALGSKELRGVGSPLITRWRDLLARWRLRGRPVGEAEFSVATCVLAPLTGAYVPVICVAATLLLVFELGTVCLAWLFPAPRAQGDAGPLTLLTSPRS